MIIDIHTEIDYIQEVISNQIMFTIENIDFIKTMTGTDQEIIEKIESPYMVLIIKKLKTIII